MTTVIDRREFLATGVGGAFALLIPQQAAGAGEAPAVLRLQIVDEANQPIWTRLEVRSTDGKVFQPTLPQSAQPKPTSECAQPPIIDTKAIRFSGAAPWYQGSFVVNGSTELTLPPDTYTIIAEHGTEYARYEKQLTITGNALLRIELRPWIRMNQRGWWSADFHIHRPPQDVCRLALAEDLNLSLVTTIWDKDNVWAGKEVPSNPIVKISDRHLMTTLNAEDERGPGGYLFLQLREEPVLDGTDQWYPPIFYYIRQIRKQRSDSGLFPWVDVEKPFWWSVPVAMALAAPDSVGIIHNHFTEYGMMAHEAWGRPRDRNKYPGDLGFVEYCLDIYYRLLNLGFNIPPSAGSASGVLPNPIGYNRIYTKLDRPLSPEAWFEAFRNGSSFVTNGPMLFTEVAPMPGQSARLKIEAHAREPLDRVEIIANGELIKSLSIPGASLDFSTEQTVDTRGRTWVAVRCFSRSRYTVHMAHSKPVFLGGVWNARPDALYFVQWMDELIEQSRSDPKRFRNDTERDEVLGLYHQARQFYLDKTK